MHVKGTAINKKPLDITVRQKLTTVHISAAAKSYGHECIVDVRAKLRIKKERKTTMGRTADYHIQDLWIIVWMSISHNS